MNLSQEQKSYLIVGLGNPGLAYEKTRHNLGFMVVKALADKLGWTFKKTSSLKGELAHGHWKDRHLYLLLPTTYMNLSGEAAKAALDYYKLSASENFLVIVDDVYLPLGGMRLRIQGSAGGHNGLKNIEQQLGTNQYPRLRLGVGSEDRFQGLHDYVLGRFTENERLELPKIIEKAMEVIMCWILEGAQAATQRITSAWEGRQQSEET